MSWGGEWVHHDVLEEGYVALVSQDHPLADRAAVGLKELAEESWATDDPLDSRWFQRIGSACKAAGFSPSVAANPSDFGAVVGFVATGEYVSVQPSLAAQSLRSAVGAIPIEDPSLRRRLSVHVRRPVAGHPAAQFVVEPVHAAAGRGVDAVPGVRPLGPGAVVRGANGHRGTARLRRVGQDGGMSSSREPLRLVRGGVAATVAAALALIGHVAGGGAMPGWLGIALPWWLSVTVCTVLAGTGFSLLRLSAADRKGTRLNS